MPEIAKPERATYFIARNGDGTIVHYGVTQPNQVTTTGQSVLEYTNEEPEYLQLASPYADRFPELPSEGPLARGEMYKFGSTVVIVRQDHERTQFDPADTPALFMTANSTQYWIENEQVYKGTRREYEGQWYEALQRHVTEFTPDQTPALWKTVSVDSGPQPWVQPTGAQDAYAQDINWGGAEPVEVTHPNAQDGGNIWLFRSKIAANVTEPGTDGTFHRWWEPVGIVS